ncbi:MAG: hypothetical protein JO270_03255 [Acidobacteriaceae bacterium]|nr:hypothetical protein [Acidobacteriaceae bacterium]MBV8572462.1 hypothetical protein [Acidobacteriaceae bacterium]
MGDQTRSNGKSEAAIETLFSFIAELRARNAKRMRFAELMAVLIAVLWWQTTWLALRPGLAVLLIGQLAIVVLVLLRNHELHRTLKLWRDSAASKSEVLAWFEREDAFSQMSTRLENGCRIAGLLLVAYGFWRMTGNVAIAVAIGVLYPLVLYFGMMRKTSAAGRRRLQKTKDEITLNLRGD